MVIQFEGTYKSLTSFISDELNDFSVVTGKNGAGKSQLIESIINSSPLNRIDQKVLS
jgi:AAA15 family ATPase/GTPase